MEPGEGYETGEDEEGEENEGLASGPMPRPISSIVLSQSQLKWNAQRGRNILVQLDNCYPKEF
jgi:hypothetical protein